MTCSGWWGEVFGNTLLLALDGADRNTSIILRSAQTLWYERTLPDLSGEEIGNVVHELLGSAGHSLRDPDLVIYLHEGPGSFTGLRLTFSFVSGVMVARELLGLPNYVRLISNPYLMTYLSVKGDSKENVNLFLPGGGKKIFVASYSLEEGYKIEVSDIDSVALKVTRGKDSPFLRCSFREVVKEAVTLNNVKLSYSDKDTFTAAEEFAKGAPFYLQPVAAKTLRERT
jgi:tRNA A37 threonylcarbamoyladenosine modification protein TsaB